MPGPDESVCEMGAKWYPMSRIVDHHEREVARLDVAVR